MSAGNLQTGVYPVAVTIENDSVAFLEVDLKDASDEADVPQPLVLKIMRQKLEHQGYLHFVRVQWHMGTEKYLFAANPASAAKVQELLLRVQDTQCQGGTWTETNFGKQVAAWRKNGTLIADHSNLKDAVLCEVIEEAHRAAGNRGREGSTAACVETPGEKHVIEDVGDDCGTVQKRLDFSSLDREACAGTGSSAPKQMPAKSMNAWRNSIGLPPYHPLQEDLEAFLEKQSEFAAQICSH